MRPIRTALAIFLALAPAVRGDWPMFGADPQRTGWAIQETMLNRSNVGTLELKWKIRLENAPKELTSLTAPIVVDQVKTVRGIKEYVVVAGSSDVIFAIDADTGKLAWQKTFEVAGEPVRKPNGLCPFALNATPAASPTGRPKTVYALSSDGRLHALSMVDGEDRFAPLPFVPAYRRTGASISRAGCSIPPSGSDVTGCPQASIRST